METGPFERGLEATSRPSCRRDAISSTPSIELHSVNSHIAVKATYMATACLFSASPHQADCQSLAELSWRQYGIIHDVRPWPWNGGPTPVVSSASTTLEQRVPIRTEELGTEPSGPILQLHVVCVTSVCPVHVKRPWRLLLARVGAWPSQPDLLRWYDVTASTESCRGLICLAVCRQSAPQPHAPTPIRGARAVSRAAILWDWEEAISFRCAPTVGSGGRSCSPADHFSRSRHIACK